MSINRSILFILILLLGAFSKILSFKIKNKTEINIGIIVYIADKYSTGYDLKCFHIKKKSFEKINLIEKKILKIVICSNMNVPICEIGIPKNKTYKVKYDEKSKEYKVN